MTSSYSDDRTNDNDHSPPRPRTRRRKRITISDGESSEDEIVDLTGRPPAPTAQPTYASLPPARTTRLLTTTLTKNLALIINRHKQNDINFSHPKPSTVKPLTSLIPSPSIATYNVTSLSADAADEVGLTRQHHMITDIG